MSEELDPLLRALGEVERDDQRRHPHAWEAALAGLTPAGQVAAERAAIDPPDEHAAFVAMFSRPVDAAEIDALVARAGALVRTKPGATTSAVAGTPVATSPTSAARGPDATSSAPTAARSPDATTSAPTAARSPVATSPTTAARSPDATTSAPTAARSPDATTSAPTNAGPAPVVPLRRRTTIAVAVVLAIAAALVLWRLPGEAPRGERIAYSLTVRNETVKTTRSSGPAAGPARYRVDSQIDWVLSPATPQREAVELRVEARDAGGQAQTLAPAFTRSPEGALRVRGRLGELLPLAPGRWRLRFVVGSAAALARGEGEALAEDLEIDVLAPG